MLLDLNFPLIYEGRVQVGNLLAGELLTIPLGLALWVVGLRWRRSDRGLQRLGGAALLLVAVAYTLGWLGLHGLLAGSALGLL